MRFKKNKTFFRGLKDKTIEVAIKIEYLDIIFKKIFQ